MVGFHNTLINIPWTCSSIIWVENGLIIALVTGAFMDAISGMAFDYIASGHYAMVVHPKSDKRDEPSALRLSKDMVEWQHKLLILTLK